MQICISCVKEALAKYSPGSEALLSSEQNTKNLVISCSKMIRNVNAEYKHN